MKFLAWFLLLVCCGCASLRYTHGIPNFSEVSPGVFRGGQPNATGWIWLHDIGAIDIKLNSGSDGYLWGEFDFPITTFDQIFGDPKPNDAVRLIDLFHSCGKPVFVHCTHGQDRTGLVIAAWRVNCGYSRRQAESEMMAHGFHPLLRGLFWAWQDYTP